MVTHLSTNWPVRSLNIGERTGSVIFCDLWSYVKVRRAMLNYNPRFKAGKGAVTMLFRPFAASSRHIDIGR
ncbi:hypothetical protein B0J12DRAFT_681476 [Macrophomina phaseolina]|uniref:Uncharacterized protein n=1 Tax=Macrophomina phaseolina TaxID=35725 RepID=A0ABQ8FWT2_9PEZI|nr:hypothetical protein B0J12DRAFT_681476 [Macrophomina phaseolina]